MPRGPGKIGIDAEVYLVSQEEKLKVKEAPVYIHVKGYMRARVTHLDVENRVLGKIIPRGKGNMLEIIGVQGGIEIRLKHPTVTWVGRKYDGIYVGFKKLQIEKLEHIVKMTYGVTPMEHLEKPKFEPL